MGNARLFFIIEKRVKKIRWKEKKRKKEIEVLIIYGTEIKKLPDDITQAASIMYI